MKNSPGCRLGLLTFFVLASALGSFVGRPAHAVASGELTEVASGDAVVARVNGVELTLEELLMRYATIPALQRYGYESSGRGLRGFLQDTVADMAIDRAAREMGVEEDPLYQSLVDIHLDQIRRDLYARRAVLAQIDESVLRQRYEEQRATRFAVAPSLHLRHILVTPIEEKPPFNSTADDAVGMEAARAKAERLGRELEGGDFAELARRQSEDASAAEGGDLGWRTVDSLEPTLAKAALSLSIGEISSPVETPLGFHLIEVLGRQAGGYLSFDMVRELLFQELVGEQLPYLAGLAQEDRQSKLDASEVEVFPELLP